MDISLIQDARELRRDASALHTTIPVRGLAGVGGQPRAVRRCLPGNIFFTP